MAANNVRSVTIDEPAILIRIKQLYRPNMPAHGLYEATRGVWRLGPRREKVRLALAVFDGIVREVYEIAHWQEAGSTSYSSRPQKDVKLPGRWEFTGHVAAREIREKYIGRSVAAYFKRGQQNPIVYVNC